MAAIQPYLRNYRDRAIIVDSIYRFSGALISEKVLPNTSCHCIRHFGGHSSKMADKEKGLSQKRRGAEFQFWLYVYVLWGTYFIESIAEYIMPVHPPFWKPFKKHDGHFQSNASISETKRRRAFNFDFMSRFCGACTCKKKYCVVCVSTKYQPFWRLWRPFYKMMAISMNNVIYFATKTDVTTILIYSCIFQSCWTEKKILRFAQSRCAHHAGGICLKMEDLSLSIILLFRNFQM